MKLSLNNFLYGVKQLVTGGGRKSDGVTPYNDSGYLVDGFDLLGSSVLATSVTYVVDANGYPALNAAASITAVAATSFVVPRDYDEATDELVVTVVAFMAAAAGPDVPTLTLTPKLQVVGSAPTTLATQTTAALSTTQTKYTFPIRGAGLKRGNIVLLTLTSGAHTTDALRVNAIQAAYRSTLVSYHEFDTTTTPRTALR